MWRSFTCFYFKDDDVTDSKTCEDPWYMNPQLVGKTRPIVQNTINLANKNKGSVCVLIELNRMLESCPTKEDLENEPDAKHHQFQFRLLKYGEVIVENFDSPSKIRDIEILERGTNSLQLKVSHARQTQGSLTQTLVVTSKEIQVRLFCSCLSARPSA